MPATATPVAATVVALLAASGSLAAQERPQPLDPVRISVGSRAADSAAAPFRSAEVLDRSAIERLPAATVGELLARALGVEVPVRSAASADLSIRGSSFEQVVVLVDGVRVSDEQTGHFDLDLAVPLEMVERVEVLRGAGAALYGPDAVGGVVNVVTRAAGGDRRVTASARGGSFGTAEAAVAGYAPAGGLRLAGGADWRRSDGHRPGTDYEMVQARASAGGSGRFGELVAEAGVGLRSFGAAEFYGAYPSHERTSTGTAAVRWTAPAAGAWQVSAVTSARRHGDRFTLYRDDPAAYQNRHVSWQAGGEFVARRAGPGPLAVAVGAEGYRAWLESARLGDRAERRVAAFGEATADLGRVGLNAGLRGDWSSEHGDAVTPTVAARVLLADGVAARLSATGGHRNPTWTDRFYEDPANVGDPDLRQERFRAGEVGVRLSRWPGVTVDAAAWVRLARDLIDWARPVGAEDGTPWRTRNVERATFTGLEARAELAGPAATRWTVRASALEVRAREIDGYVGRYALRPLDRSAALGVEAPLGDRVTVAADAGWAGHVGERAFFRADARLAYDLGRALLTLDGTNLTGADYLDASAQPVMGRAFHVGVAWR